MSGIAGFANTLSTHLTLGEVLASDNAKRLGLSNIPTPEHHKALVALAGAIFEPLRVNMQAPVYVTSGYRSEALNAATPGASKTSQHSVGEALDLDQDGRGTSVTNRDLFLFIRDTLPFDQLIWEFGTDANPDWVHVSYTALRRRRGEILRAGRGASGKVAYARWDGPKGTGRG